MCVRLSVRLNVSFGVRLLLFYQFVCLLLVRVSDRVVSVRMSVCPYDLMYVWKSDVCMHVRVIPYF